MLGICGGLDYILSRLHTNDLLYHTDETVQSASLESLEPHKLEQMTISGLKKNPVNVVYTQTLSLNSCFREDQVFIKQQLRQRNPNAFGSNPGRK